MSSNDPFDTPSSGGPQNPYQAPVDVSTSDPFSELGYSGQEELARRFTRFAAAMVDGFTMMLIIVPIYIATGVLQRIQAGQAGVVEQLGISALGFGVFILLHGYLLANRGQTIGKWLTKIQIVDYESNRLLPLMKLVVFRYLWILPFSILVVLIPGPQDDLLVNLLSLVDSLFIFGAARRCLHDLIAGTHVVLYQPGRPRVTG